MSNPGTELTWYDLPELRSPFLVVAFEGLFDAAEAATQAADWLRERTESASVAMVDPETFFNFQESRPIVRIDEGGERVIEWPTTEVYSVITDSARDLVVMTGVEPHLRWSSFADHVLEVAQRSGCEMVVTLGAFIGMVPHTRPFSVVSSAVHPDLARRLNLSRPSYQGPTGIVGVINSRLEAANVPVISLRVEVPHYVPGPPNPKAMQALLRRLEQTSGVSTGYEDLDSEVTQWMNRVDEAVKSDPESNDYVERLERQVDSDEEMLPTGDDLAAELEAFLREQKPSEDDSSASEDPADPSASDDPTAADDSGAGKSGDGKSGEGTDSDSGSDGDSDSD